MNQKPLIIKKSSNKNNIKEWKLFWFQYQNEKKKVYYKYFGWRKKVYFYKNRLYLENFILLVNDNKHFNKLLYNRKKDSYYFCYHDVFWYTDLKLIQRIKKKIVSIFFFIKFNKFLINQKNWIYVSEQIIFNRHFLYSYIFLKKKLYFWKNIYRLFLLTDKHFLILINSLSIFECFQVYFINLFSLEIYFKTLNFIYFKEKKIKVKMKTKFKKVSKFFFKISQERKIFYFLKNILKNLADYKRPLGKKLVNKAFFFFKNQQYFINWKCLNFSYRKLKFFHHCLIFYFQRLLYIKKTDILAFFNILQSLIFLGLICKSNSLKIIKQLKKELFFLTTKFEILKLQFVFMHTKLKKLKFLTNISFFNLIILNNNRLFINFLNFFIKKNLILQCFFFKRYQSFIFSTLIIKYKINIYNDYRLKFFDLLFFFKLNIFKLEKDKISKLLLLSFKNLNLKYCIIRKLLKFKKILKKIELCIIRKEFNNFLNDSIKSPIVKIHIFFTKKRLKRLIKFIKKKRNLKKNFKIFFLKKIKKVFKKFKKDLESQKRIIYLKKLDESYDKDINRIFSKVLNLKLYLQVEKSKIKENLNLTKKNKDLK